jgi:transcriptional regulator with XRE-family HTH domain
MVERGTTVRDDLTGPNEGPEGRAARLERSADGSAREAVHGVSSWEKFYHGQKFQNREVSMEANHVQIAFSEVLGGVLRHYRKAASNRAQKALADAAEISVSSWSRVEAGQASLTVEQLRLAARELGTQAWVIMKEAEEVCDGTATDQKGVKVVDQRPAHRAGAGLLAASAVGFLVGAYFASKNSGSR